MAKTSKKKEQNSSVDKFEIDSSMSEESSEADSESESEAEEHVCECAKEVYQLKITLKYSKPPIWRRILVSNDSTFADLHIAVISAMGWLDTHLHVFTAFDVEIGKPGPEDDMFPSDKLDEKKVKLCQYFNFPKDSIDYCYDFGDNWMHRILLEKILPFDDRSYPICVGGRRACPPDDCGGIGGYEELLVTLADPEHSEHQRMKDWMRNLGKEDFNPAVFDPSSVDFEYLRETFPEDY